MELNPAVTDPSSEWRVTTGLLVSEMVLGRIQTGDRQFLGMAPSTQTVAGDPGVPGNPRYLDFTRLSAIQTNNRSGQAVTEQFAPGRGVTQAVDHSVRDVFFVPETGHNIPDVFLNYLTASGPILDATGKVTTAPLFDWVYVMGYPITEPYWVSLTISGKQYTALLQLYQRRVLTYVPDFPQGWQVQMGNTGQHYYNWRYPSGFSGGVTSPAPVATPAPVVPATGSFVGISGDSFTYHGANVDLKGTNYWTSTQPFAYTWAKWDGNQVLAELKKARDMGVNTIRVGLPYDHVFTLKQVWDDDKQLRHIGKGIINEMTQFLQIAGVYGMKVIFVLFEWYDKYPAQGSTDDRTNIIYIQGIVGHFANDDRILAWDLHNEPDNYDTWEGGGKNTVIKWLQRIAGYVRAVDSRHPITVGVGNYRNLWESANDGTTILSFVDFAAFHCYDAGALGAQIADTKAHTQKPVLLEEMGWPTAPGANAPKGVVFSETQQNYLYNTMLAASKSNHIAGVIQWTLSDFPAASTTAGKYASYEENFGLIRLDGSLKPAANIFKTGYTARELPSDTITNEGLSKNP